MRRMPDERRLSRQRAPLPAPRGAMRAVHLEHRLRKRGTDLRSRWVHLPLRLHDERRLLGVRALLQHDDVVVRRVLDPRTVCEDGDAHLQRGWPLRHLRGRHGLSDVVAVLPDVRLRPVPQQARLPRRHADVLGGYLPLRRTPTRHLAEAGRGLTSAGTTHWSLEWPIVRPIDARQSGRSGKCPWNALDRKEPLSWPRFRCAES